MTHPMLGILLANPSGFAGSVRHRAVAFEPITPFPALSFVLWGIKIKKKLPQYGRMGCVYIR